MAFKALSSFSALDEEQWNTLNVKINNIRVVN